MLLGCLANAILPITGIEKPISTLPLLIVWMIVLGILCAIAYIRDKNFAVPTSLEISKLLSPQLLVLILLPLLAVLGTQVVNLYSSNIVLMILIVLIGIIFLIMTLSRFIPVPLYPLAIFCIALALVWHFSLISDHLIGYDVFEEYYFFSQVANSGIWNPGVPFVHIYNEMLSVTILPAIFSQILAMGGEQVFKIIYPFCYALLPLALYVIYDKQFNSKYALTAVFFFMAIYPFFLEIPSVEREILAELFVALLIMLVIDSDDNVGKRVLFIIFGLGLVVSHYSLSFLYLGFLSFSLIVLFLLKTKSLRITFSSVALFAVICLAWYLYISGSQSFKTIAITGKDILQNFSAEFFNPFSRDVSLYIVQTSATILYSITKIFNFLMLFFIVVGSITLISELRHKNHMEFSALALCNYLLLGAAIAIPFFSERLGADRILHIAAMVIAPYCILGAGTIFKLLSHLDLKKKHINFRKYTPLIMAPILVILFG